MKGYVEQLLNGGYHLNIETNERNIHWIFNGPDEDEVIPFEGNSREIYEEIEGFLHEAYFPDANDQDIFLQINQIPGGGVVVTFSNHGEKIYQYIANQDEAKFDVFSYANDEIKMKIAQAQENGSSFGAWLGQCAVQPTIYKLKDAWLIMNFEIVYGKHANSIDIIADSRERALEIENLLFARLRNKPISHKSRLERFCFNKNFDKYNGSEECNKLRHKYLTI